MGEKPWDVASRRIYFLGKPKHWWFEWNYLEKRPETFLGRKLLCCTTPMKKDWHQKKCRIMSEESVHWPVQPKRTISIVKTISLWYLSSTRGPSMASEIWRYPSTTHSSKIWRRLRGLVSKSWRSLTGDSWDSDLWSNHSQLSFADPLMICQEKNPLSSVQMPVSPVFFAWPPPWSSETRLRDKLSHTPHDVQIAIIETK